MAWFYNYDGNEMMQGWLYQQGDWSWGACLTWHVIDLGGHEEHIGHDYTWACHLWLWNYDHGWRIYKLNIEHIHPVRPCDVAWNPWMEHPVCKWQ